MKRFHVSVSVADLGRSIEFYETLFGQPPTVRKDDYAKWMLDDPRVNFALTKAEDRFGVDHLGIQAETRDEMSGLRLRLAQIGTDVLDEGETACCYAKSDKTWMIDEQRVQWEMFFTHGESDQLAPVSVGGSENCCDKTAERCC